MSKNVSRYIQLGAIGLLLIVFIIANYFINFYKGIIDQYLEGYHLSGTVLDPTHGDGVVQKVSEEGFVLLKNDNNTLPLKNTTKINMFGWGSTDEGMLICGGGSGDFTMVSGNETPKEIIGLQRALEELEDLHPEGFECDGNCAFEVNQDLVDFYESYCTVNRNGGTDSRPGWFNYSADPKYFNLVEPDISTYPAGVLDSAKDFSETAVIVITRTGGESLDLPKYQRIYTPVSGQPASINGSVAVRNDKTYLQLSNEEEGMIDYVKDNFENVIVILNTSTTLECGFLEDDAIDAAIYIATPGQSGTVALANILRGNVNPSGKLVDTFAYDLRTAATWANSPNANEENLATAGVKTYNGGSTSGNYIDYAEGIYVGYKWYETADKMGYWNDVSNKYGTGYSGVVQYPFGFGLSYTDFTWTVRGITPSNNANITANTEIKIEVDVKNVGTVKGQDVVEIYYEPPYTPGGIEKSSSNLVAFAKTEILEPQGVQTLTLTFKAEDMKSYDYSDANSNDFSGYELESGDYFVKLSKDAHHVSSASGSGISNGTITYKVASTIKIDKDSTTGYTVENRFTGDTADGGVSIDGTNSNANIAYLTRANFKGSFPEESTERRVASSNFNANGWKSTGRDTDVPPTQDNGSRELMLVQNNEYNMELIDKLGSEENFNDPIWDQLLNQITETELQNVVMKGGYATWQIPSIGKPKMTDLDGPTGFNRHPHSAPQFTGFPSAIIVAGTWNTNIAYYYGQVIGTEGTQSGLGGWYAPGVNIHRSPFDGRNYEYFSEDGYISGMIGAHIIYGALETGIYSYVKHFAINETENNRNGLYTWLTEQALREVYLKPFEISVKVGKANAIMTSYNRIGDTWTGGSYGLMTEILRNEWGFKGTAISDYLDGSDSYKVIDQGIRAGSDIWLENGNDAAPGNIGYNDRTSATAVACAREATKHVIYTYCNTIKIKTDAGNATGEVIAAVEKFSTWKYGWIFGDILIFGGLAVWAFFVLKKLIAERANKSEPLK